MKVCLIDALTAIEKSDTQKAVAWLRVDNCYCIEGALCEQYRQQTGNGEWYRLTNETDPVYAFGMGGFNSEYSIMPPEVRAYFGIPFTGPSLISINDQNDGLTLQQVAAEARKALEEAEKIDGK